MMSGTAPPGGFHRTTAVVEPREAGRYFATSDSGRSPGLRRLRSSWCKLTRSCGSFDLAGSFRLL